MAMLLWMLWWRRNKKCWNDKNSTVFEVTRRARENLMEWTKMQKRRDLAGRNDAPAVDKTSNRKT
ncbi:hypothetical protein TSUD_339140 [Trifolium subterraneum]|nr:hypothetical protein TSUD_339140 [Trifolium subterraneum]